MNAYTMSIGFAENLQAGHHYFKLIHRQQREFHLPIYLQNETITETADEALLKRLTAIVCARLSDEQFGVADLAREAGFCRRQLHRKLRGLTNQPPSRFIRTLRLQRAAALIRRNADTLAGIAYRCGFNTPNYFTKVFRQEFGCTPKAFREN